MTVLSNQSKARYKMTELDMNITHPKHGSQDLKIINFGFSKRQWQGQEDIKSKKRRKYQIDD